MDQPLEQHDDHCWFNVAGEPCYIREVRHDPVLVFYYTCGYSSALHSISFEWFDYEQYCNQAVRNIYTKFPKEMSHEKGDRN